MNLNSLVTTGKAKVMAAASAVSSAFFMLGMNVYASSGEADLSKVTSPIIGLLNSILDVAIPLVAAAGAIYCVLLGVKFARAEEPQDREKAKSHLKNAIIGFVLIFVLIVALRIATPLLTDWMNSNS